MEPRRSVIDEPRWASSDFTAPGAPSCTEPARAVLSVACFFLEDIAEGYIYDSDQGGEILFHDFCG